MKQKLNTGVLLLSLGMGTAFADLVPLGANSLQGEGLGHVDTVLTMQSPGSSTMESGCVGAGPGGTTVTGPTKCPRGSGPNGGTSFTGGNEQAINNVFSASSLGLTDFNNLRILFNADQPAGGPITLTNLALGLWSPSGSFLDFRYVASPPVMFASTNPGIGNAGFFFGLDSTEAAVANGILAGNPNLLIGLAANASMATGGPETFSVGVSGATPIPEPAAFVPIALVMAVFALRKRLQFR